MDALSAIDTPAVLVDLDVAEANIARYQAYCDRHGLRLRPHLKTHKSPVIAGRQRAAGAVGVTCQKVSEAETLAADGEDVLITYNIVGAAKLARLRALAARVRLSVSADHPAVVAGLSGAFADAPAPLRVLVECDTGAGRCGVASPADAAALAARIAAAPGLRFGGLMTYPPAGGLAAADGWLAEAKARCAAAGLAVETVSCGGSPDMWRAHEAGSVTEWRIGTYVYNDRSLVARGVCSWGDVALSVLATVVSTPAPDRAIVDAGSKILTSDLFGMTGHGAILGRPDLRVDQLSEEHGRIVGQAPLGLSVGERLRIVPNHACVVVNMVDAVQTLRGGAPAGPLPVAARGAVL